MLQNQDPEIYNLIQKEVKRQSEGLEMIPSENHTSGAVLEALGSRLTDKYSEGYPGARYYGGCENVDIVENLARDRAKALFGSSWANVQPHSGGPANLAVYFALLNPGDTIMGLKLFHGGHMTHGLKPNFSGTYYKSVQYGCRPDGFIDLDEMRRLAHEHKPKMIVTGGSAYPQIYEWAKYKEIADEVGALMLADMAHVAGLVAGGVYPSPVGIADVVTTTTHKTLRGPLGGIILTNNEELAKKINSAVFPGLQGGPLMHVIAAKAVAFGEALQPEFKEYIKQVVANSKILAKVLMARGLKITTGGTDCHLMVVDLTPLATLTGKEAEKVLEHAGLTCNKNAIPNDPRSPFVTSGLRFGTSAGTTRGFKEKEFERIGHMICDVLEGFVKNGEEGNKALEAKVKAEIVQLCQEFPIY